jgi:drug/metabolite transporter (DMT)-like permease
MNGLWILFTVAAAAGQTARNVMQRELTATLGAAGATHVRFLFGFPFALAIFTAVGIATGGTFPHPTASFWIWIGVGALTQILATAMMLMAMAEKSFVVTVAYIKTEPILVAIFGLIFLGEMLSPAAFLAILVATAGVLQISFASGTGRRELRPAARGLAAAMLFAVSAVSYRGAIVSLSGSSFVMAASFSLAIGLTTQALLLSLYLYWRRREVFAAIFRLWRPSLFAGFMGAFATEFWFLAFALTSAANVRTLALIEVLFAQGATHFLFKQKVSKREAAGIALIVAGCALLIWIET